MLQKIIKTPTLKNKLKKLFNNMDVLKAWAILLKSSMATTAKAILKRKNLVMT